VEDDSNVISFEEVTRHRATPRRFDVTLEDLMARQADVPCKECHAGFLDMTYDEKLKASKIRIFEKISAAFPKGRRICILGHGATGKSVILDLLQQRIPPSRGKVIVNSRLGWQVNSMSFFDTNLSLDHNVCFIANVIGIRPSRLRGAVRDFCDLSDRSFRNNLKELPVWVRRRLSFLAVAYCGLDCHLVDAPFSPINLKLDGSRADMVTEFVYGRDYIATARLSKKVPPNCDLVYLLFEGRLYMFEDIDAAKDIFDILPEPSHGPRKSGAADEGGNEAESGELVF